MQRLAVRRHRGVVDIKFIQNIAVSCLLIPPHIPSPIARLHSAVGCHAEEEWVGCLKDVKTEVGRNGRDRPGGCDANS